MTGFEPVMRESKSLALPLGYTPILYPPQTHNTKHEKKERKREKWNGCFRMPPRKGIYTDFTLPDI